MKQYAMCCGHKNNWKIGDILSQNSLLDLLPLFPLIFDTLGLFLGFCFSFFLISSTLTFVPFIYNLITPKFVSLASTSLLSSRPKYSNIQRTHLLKDFASTLILLSLLHHQSSLPSWRNPPLMAYVSSATTLLFCSPLYKESSHFLSTAS